MKTSSGSKKCHQYTHEYVYHHEITEDVASNNNVPQSYHILLYQHYRTWDPHLCHWTRFDWSLESCMHLENGGLPTWRYKHIHDFLMRHLLYVHFYYVVM